MRTLQSFQRAPRHVRMFAALMLTGALLVMPAGKPPATQAAGQLITQQEVSTGDDNSEAPEISVGSDRLGVSWGERNDQRLGTNTTTIGTRFPAPTYFSATGASFKQQFPDVAVGSDGTIHVVYATGDQIYYRRKLKDAGWQSQRPVARSSFPNPVKLAIGGDGVLWAVWRDADGTGVFYRRSSDGINWTNGSDGGKVHGETGNMFTPDVAVGPDNVAHVVWYLRSGGVNKGQIRVADWNGSSFSTSNVTTDGFYDADPAITVDSGNIQHVVWRKQVSTDQWAISYASRAAGQSWANFSTLAVTSGDAAYSPAVGVDEKGNVYATYSNPNRSTRQVQLYGKTATGKWEKVLQMPAVGWDSRSAVTGRSGEAHVAYQVERTSDQGQIVYVRVAFNSTPAINATPKIAGGNPTTKDNPVSVGFDGLAGDPKELRWRWGAAPTDAANDSSGWQLFGNPKVLALPSTIDTSATAPCQPLTLYTQVRNGTTNVQATAGQDDVLYDGAAQATVRVSNPFLAGLPKTFSQKIADTYTSPTDGAFDGDSRYTRMPQYFAGIYNNSDCSGLSTYNIPASAASGSLTSGSFEGKLTLGQGSQPNPGEQIPIVVNVFDQIGNKLESTKQLIYDPANTAQTGSANTEGLPVYNGGSFSIDTANSIIRKLSFTGVSVDDTVYGKFENLAKGKQFWGVWIANSTTQVTNPNAANSTLQWFPVQVATPSATFSVTWNIFNGIAPLDRKPGIFYVYVKFLDGAGNATIGTMPVKQAELKQGYSTPTLYLSQITK